MMFVIGYILVGLIAAFSLLIFARVQNMGDDATYPLVIMGGILWPISIIIGTGMIIVALMDAGATSIAKRIKNR